VTAAASAAAGRPRWSWLAGANFSAHGGSFPRFSNLRLMRPCRSPDHVHATESRQQSEFQLKERSVRELVFAFLEMGKGWMTPGDPAGGEMLAR
jgi:hypothetical protein